MLTRLLKELMRIKDKTLFLIPWQRSKSVSLTEILFWAKREQILEKELFIMIWILTLANISFLFEFIMIIASKKILMLILQFMLNSHVKFYWLQDNRRLFFLVIHMLIGVGKKQSQVAVGIT